MSLLQGDQGFSGTGVALTLGTGNELVYGAIQLLAGSLVGLEIDGLMAEFGPVFRKLANHPQLCWLGPHKGVVHLARPRSQMPASTFRQSQTGSRCGVSPLISARTRFFACSISATWRMSSLPKPPSACSGRKRRGGRWVTVLLEGYPGYDASVGWLQYRRAKIKEEALRAQDQGSRAFKVKVGSSEGERDIARATMLREAVGPDVPIMLDANQQWTLPRAIQMCKDLAAMSPYWTKEPMHPDDVLAHRRLAEAIAPVPSALGEHVPNRIVFKNFMQARTVQ